MFRRLVILSRTNTTQPASYFLSKILEPKPHRAFMKLPMVKAQQTVSMQRLSGLYGIPFYRIKKWFQVRWSFIGCPRMFATKCPHSKANNQTEKLKERWNACRTIPRTHAIHFASKADEVTIKAYLYSGHHCFKTVVIFTLE